jgi:hypothetical protein
MKNLNSSSLLSKKLMTKTGREISGRQFAIGDQIFSFGDRNLPFFSELDLCEKK